MFFLNPPEVRTAEVWTRLPDAFRRPQRSAWGDANRPGLVTDSFLEGPVFDRDGNLYVTDIPHGRIFKISPDAQWSLIAEWDGEPNGLTWLDDQHLLITDYRHGLMVCAIASGDVRPYLLRRVSERFKGVNDLIFDRSGNLYFTDQGQTGLHDPTGRLYRLRPDGQLDCLLNNVPSPNGVALSPDERVLYLAVTRGNQVWRVPLADDGGVTKVSAFFTSYGPSGPDGLAVDQRGRLLVANPGLGYVWVLNHRGEPEQVIRSPVGASLTNLAFAPAAASAGPAPGSQPQPMLYCTESVTGSVLRIAMDSPGLLVA